MRVTDIKVGHTYTDGKYKRKIQRIVIEYETDAYDRYAFARKDPHCAYGTTPEQFARWAKADVTEEVKDGR